ncbi:MAG: LVIVD repeat-containing protein [Acidiphilium sp.]
MTDLLKPSHAHNMRILGHTDQGGGRADGVQIMVHKGHAYIGHIFSKGFSVVNVADPTRPAPVAYIPAPPNTWTLHLQQHEDLLLVVHAKDMFAQAELADEKNYYKSKGGFQAAPETRNWSAGLAVYDIGRPGAPRQIGFMPVEGGGLHRCWYTGGRWAYASALLDGFSDYILVTIDMADPTKPELVGRYWLPGMNLAAGETPDWPSEVGRFGLHHAIIRDDIAYCSWRDACLAVVDVADKANPSLIVHKTWAPPFGGGTHNALPLPERDLLIVVDETVLDNREDGEKPIWVFDNRIKSNPISIATFPEPAERDYVAVGGHFGPHNIYENRPNGLVSETLIFATYQNAGLRVFDIGDKFRPVEVGACVPPAPVKLVDPRPNRPKVLHSADVFVDRDGICYCTDFSAGLYIIEYNG